MKSVRSLLWAGGFLVAISGMLSGCMSGTVRVTNAGEASGAPGGSPEVGHQASGEASGQTPGETTAPVAEPEVNRALYFGWFSSETPSTLNGLGFLSAQSLNASPFQFTFQTDSSVATRIVYWRPVLLGGMEELAWIAQSPSGSYELEILDPSSMQSQRLASVPAAQSYALLGDAGVGALPELALIGSAGNLLVMGSSGQWANGRSGFSQGSRVDWIDAGDLAVSDPVAKTISIFSATDILKPTRTLRGDGFSASPDGRSDLLFVAGIGGASGQLSVIDPTSGSMRSLTIGAVGAVTFEHPRWSGSRVAFVDVSSTGTRVDVVSPLTSELSTQYSVSPPASGAGSICPSWVGGELFFAGENEEGSSVIWEADGTSLATRTFAVPGDSDQGYDCPKGVSE